ncbi:MAG TPA: MFS transporter [Candidatus Acidoferrum sp.]|nr:MFS transporter [Candidatus Acidoferrum sp.]
MQTPANPAPKPGIGRYRWIICALLFFATTVNYLDRQVFGILGPELQKVFGWSGKDYTDIVFWFEAAYGIGLAGVGRLLDRIGTRIGYALSLVWWSVAAMLHAMMSSIAGFSVARFLLGIGESGNFPAAIKTVAEWFPRHERAFATGIFNAGSNVGAILAPLIVPWLYITVGWQWAFIATGACGFIWLLFWLWIYRTPDAHPRLQPAERDYINSDPPEPATPIPWRTLFAYRQTWAIVIGKFLTDSVWRCYLYLLPLFFSQQFNLDIKNFGPPFVIIYAISDVGSIAGGWLSSHLLARGRTLNFSRKTAMLLCALCVIPVVFVTQVGMWYAVALVSLAAAAHQGWSANIFTTASDLFPKQAVGSLVGLGGTAGAFGAMLILKVTGYVLDLTGSFITLFVIAGSAYVIAWVIFHLLVPRMDPAKIAVG